MGAEEEEEEEEEEEDEVETSNPEIIANTGFRQSLVQTFHRVFEEIQILEKRDCPDCHSTAAQGG